MGIIVLRKFHQGGYNGLKIHLGLNKQLYRELWWRSLLEKGKEG